MSSIVALVSTYNSAEFIANRLDNLLNQTVEGLQIYVLDACSLQNEGEIVREFMRDPRAVRTPIKYERTYSRIGLYAAWNAIIKNSGTSKYLATANTDDIIHPDYYKRAIEVLHQGPFDLVYCPWLVSPVVNQKWPPAEGTIDGVVDPEPTSTCGHFPVWRRALHANSKIGLFDERFKVIGDSVFWARLRHYGARIGKVPEVMGCYATRGVGNLYWSAKDQQGNQLCQTEESLARSVTYE